MEIVLRLKGSFRRQTAVCGLTAYGCVVASRASTAWQTQVNKYKAT